MSIAKQTIQLIKAKRYNEAFALNTGLAYKVAFTFQYKGRMRGMTLEDLDQEALLNLWIAIHDFKAEKNFCFSTFAIRVMRNKFLNLFETERPMLSGDDSEVISRARVSDDVVFDRTLVREVVGKFSLLNKMERDCVIAMCTDINNREVSELHGCTHQNISVARERALGKLREVV